jgi:hypothetical protein
MLIQDVEAKIKAAGYDQIKRASSTRLVVYMEEDRKIALPALAAAIGGTFTSNKTGSGWKSSVGAILIDSFVILAKPLTKGVSGNIASLDARLFSATGQDSTYNYLNSDVTVKKFTSADQIKNGILKGCATSSMLGEPYVEMFTPFFDGGKIEWAPDTPPAVINKLGVYIGELLVGWVILARKETLHFKTRPFSGTPKAFYLPTDPSFSGVDSFIEMVNNDVYGISSKFGVGAKASIFTNLLKNGIKKQNQLSASVFKDLCQVVTHNNLTYNNSRAIVYAYGVRNILGLSKAQISNPNDVYDQAFRHNKDAKELNLVVNAIMNSRDASSEIKKELPNSISAFFNRTIADRLNKDKASQDQIVEILTGKDYWQANLDIVKWKNGEVSFSFVRSSKANVKIIGSKASIGDITAKQGWINYELS